MRKRERRKIYLEAAEFFGDFKRIQTKGTGGILTGFCDYCVHISVCDCEEFYEYQLFKPVTNTSYWFENQEDRAIALLLAAEMCKY